MIISHLTNRSIAINCAIINHTLLKSLLRWHKWLEMCF